MHCAVEPNFLLLLLFFSIRIFQILGAILKDQHQGYVHYQIDSTNVSWAHVFKILEDNKTKYNIEDYSIGQTSLEQVRKMGLNLIFLGIR